MKNRSVQIARRAVSETADDVRMAHAVERNRFVLKIFDQRAFQIGVQIVLQENVESFDNDLFVRRLRRSQTCRGRRKFRRSCRARASCCNVVASVEPASFVSESSLIIN